MMGTTKRAKRRVHIVINPAAGSDIAVLSIINTVFQQYNVAWDASITHKPGDARRQARSAAERGVDLVAVYGGDGSVAEAASGLLGLETPLAIFPGGTANVAAMELGIPSNLRAACQLALGPDHRQRRIDMGTVNDNYFLLRVGIGTEALITAESDRAAKDRLGFLAYVRSALMAVGKLRKATYYLTVDGAGIAVVGVTCGIANSGSFGVRGLQISPRIKIDDGYLDVMVIRDVGIPTLVDILSSLIGSEHAYGQNSASNEDLLVAFGQSLYFGKCREIRVRTDPPQTVQYDGELLEGGPEVRCRVLPQALTVIVPS